MTNREKIDELTRRWRRAVWSRDLGFALEMGLLATLALAPFWHARMWLAALVAVAAVTLAARLFLHRPWRIDAARLVRHLDRTYPELEESGALFLRPAEELSLVERLQLKRVVAAVASKHADPRAAAAFGRPPDRKPSLGTVLRKTAILLAVAAAGWWAHRQFSGPIPGHPSAATPAPAVASPALAPAAVTWPKIVGGGLVVTPPAYTGRPTRTVEGFNAEVEEGATVTWTVALDRPVCEARLVFGQGDADTLPLAPLPGDGSRLGATRVVGDLGLYHLTALLPDGNVWNPSELYAFKVIEDRPPALRIVRPAVTRMEIAPTVPVVPPLPPAPPPRVEVEVAASDDYGLVDVHLVATVAKGSGEAVKFREQTIPFDGNEPAGDAPHARRFTRTLDLAALGLAPGDELYFHVEASDNRQPTANRARSETRFIRLKGPAEVAVTTGQGVRGVNLVPQYFRSERQIIIDTEKLLADRPTLTDAAFRERANDLGVDQQLLRLRYGQLLGEELEGGSGDHAEVNLNPLQATAPEQAPGPHAAASITQRFLQEHEDQNRQGGSDEQRAAGGGAPADTGRPLAAAQVLAPFVDQHDSQDKATYHDEPTKGTMRDALAAMWEAEGLLRTARPADALAPEHRALDVLKLLQQSARAYVQHVGFEAAPIRVAERRLAGDAADVPARGSVADAPAPDDPARRAAAEALGALPWDGAGPGAAAGTAGAAGGGVVLDAGALDVLRRVEPALTAAATRQPDVFLGGLLALRRLLADGGRVGAGAAGTGGAEMGGKELEVLQRALWRLLPPAERLPSRGLEGEAALAGEYFGAWEKEGKPEARP